MRPMSPDLAFLGDQLEAAVHRDVRRRRARRQLFFNAAASLIVAIPLAISIATADLGGEPSQIGAAGASSSLNWTPGFDLSFRHIPDKPIQTREWARCLDARDCLAISDPVPFAIDFPPRRA
jgi:hypothetical protein